LSKAKVNYCFYRRIAAQIGCLEITVVNIAYWCPEIFLIQEAATNGNQRSIANVCYHIGPI